MTMERVPMTIEGFRKLETELQRLKSEERPRIIALIAEARQHGDLSENAESHAAKEAQGWNEARVAELEDRKIVGDFEASVRDGKISISSPIARALIGKTKNDTVEVTTPKGARSYKLLKIEWK